jgi:tetratricopeptide (TPR) repeat protein
VHPKLSALRPEILAQHYEEAARYELAADRWFDAGKAAAGTWAKTEAARMFALALECLEKLPASIERKKKAVQYELERGDVLYAAYGFVTHEGSEAYQRAMKLSEELGEPEAPIRALDGLFGTHFNSAQFNQAEGAADRLIDIGRSANNVKALVLGLEFKGMSRFCQGDYEGARSFLEQALQHEDMAETVGSDFPSMALLYLSWTLHILGYRERAVHTFDKAERIVRRQSAYRLAAYLGNGCVLFALRRDGRRVRMLVEELIPLARENGFNLWLNMALFFDGWVKATLDGDGSGLRSMQEVVDGLGEQEIDKTSYLGFLADAHVQTGNLQEAGKTVDRALEQAATTGERYFEPELLRIRGEVELNWKHDPRAAEESFRQALALARERKARAWELKAAENLADLLRSENRPEASWELEQLIHWFDRLDKPIANQ